MRCTTLLTGVPNTLSSYVKLRRLNDGGSEKNWVKVLDVLNEVSAPDGILRDDDFFDDCLYLLKTQEKLFGGLFKESSTMHDAFLNTTLLLRCATLLTEVTTSPYHPILIVPLQRFTQSGTAMLTVNTALLGRCTTLPTEVALT